MLPSNATIEEIERRAYIAGDVQTAAILRELIETREEVPACGHSSLQKAYQRPLIS